MDRRTLLQLSGLSFIGLQFGLLAGCERQAGSALSTPVSAPEIGKALRDLGASLSGIEYVGPACRQEFEEGDLAKALLQRLEPFREQSLLQALIERFRSDHEAGERIDIGGWQLALTECMLLAVAAQAQGLGESRPSDLPDLRFEPFAEIERWGPKDTIEGKIFNPIGNGRGGFWVRVESPVPRSTRLVLDGVELSTHFEPGLVTASLEPDYMDEVISNSGMYELLMVDISRNVAQRVGHLTVRAKPPRATLDDGSRSRVFCEVERWGPDHAPQGQAFNEQPDGSAAFWVRIGCAPETAQLVLEGEPLPTTVRSNIVTARVPHYAQLAKGEHKLVLHDPESDEKLTVGTMSIF